MDIVFIICLSFYLVYFLIMIPIQYSYISEMKQRLKNKSHNEVYDSMSFEEQELHYNAQGNLLNLPSNLVAQLIYTLRHRKES